MTYGLDLMHDNMKPKSKVFGILDNNKRKFPIAIQSHNKINILSEQI